MAFSPGEVVPRAQGRLPVSMLTRPGANTPTTHLTDATSGGSAGYGSYVDPAYNQALSQYVSALPSVAAAKLAITSQGGPSYDAMRQAIQDAAIQFGDPSVLSKLTTIDPRTGQRVSILDQNTAGLAATNTGHLSKTLGADPSQIYGNSVLGQLKFAADQALQQKLGSIGGGIGSGTQLSGGWGVARNQANINYGQNVYNAESGLLNTSTGAINTNQATQQGLLDKYSNALTQGSQTVGQHPGQFPIPFPKINTVGGGMIPNGPGQSVSPYPQTSAFGFKAAPGGPGALPYRTGALPAPPLPKPPAAPTLGLGHVT